MMNQKTVNILLLSVCFSIVLASCQKNKKTNTPHKNWKSITQWSFTGKMAIRDNNNSGSGRVKWQVTQQQTVAQFKAPLGQGSWKVIEDQHQAQLISSQTGETYGPTAQQLISQEIGWYFPWKQLKYWLRAHKKDENSFHLNNIDSIYDDGWSITYDKWITTPAGLLPKKIKAEKPPYSVKLLIYDWHID